MSAADRIIKYLEENKLSTEEIGDVLGKTGLVKGAYPIVTDTYLVGKVQFFYSHSNSNWPLHEQLRELKKGHIVFVDTFFTDDYYAVFGELVSTFIYDKCGAKGIVVNGNMRDLDGIRNRKIPVWCKGITPIGCFNIPVAENNEIKRLANKGKDYYDESIAVCDNSGVVIIPKEQINDGFIEKMEFLAEQERIWFDCVENKGWNTYDTVCLKKYKTDER